MPEHRQPSPAIADSALTPERLARLRQLHEAASPGPWEHGTGPYGWDIEANGELIAEVAGEDSKPRSLYDARLIAEARNALPDLLDEVERLRPPSDGPDDRALDIITGLEQDLLATAAVLRGIVRDRLGPDFIDPEVGGALAVAAHMDATELARFLAAELREPGSWTPEPDDRGEGGRSAPCVPGTPSDAEAPSPQPSFPDIWAAVARVLTGTDEPGVDSAFTVEDITKAVWAVLHPEVTEGETP